MEYPRYMTFAPGELEAEIRRIGKSPVNAPVNLPAVSMPAANAAGNGGGRSKLLKELTVIVAYPDGTGGSCNYRRMGPNLHMFEYDYGDGARLSRQHVMKALENDPASIEGQARDGAEQAFHEAVLWERKDRFCRASEPSDGSRMKEPSKYQMGAKAAKEQAGKYAVCQRLGSGDKLLPASDLFDTIEEANEAWVQMGRPECVVACCDRLDRCWGVPKYNPMPGMAREKESKEACHDAE